MDEQNSGFPSPVQPQQPLSESVVQPQQPFGAQPQQPTAQPGGFGGQAPFRQPYGAAQSQQPYGGQPATPPPGYVPGAQPYGAAAHQPPASTGKATASLVCGIAAIVICFVLPFIGAPVGLILGIAAIVLGGSFIKKFGPFGRAKAGRICGVIGLILSALSLVLTLAVVALSAAVGFSVFNGSDILDIDSYTYQDNPFVQEEPAASPLDLAAAEQEVSELVSAQFGLLAGGDAEVLALVGDVANQGFKEGTGLTLEECGIDPLDYARAITEGLSFRVDEVVFYDEATGYAGVHVNCKDIFEVYSLFYERADTFAQSAEAQSMTDEEYNAHVGEILMDVIDQVSVVEEINWAIIDVELVDGAWSINQETWEFELDYMFALA